MSGQKQVMDTGWAWVVLVCSWVILFLFTFLGVSAGIMQVEMIEDLGVGSGPISIMTSCALGMSCLLGPVSGVLAHLLSVRVTVYLGAILMSFGMLGTSFSHSLPVMMIFYGVITGLGYGLAYSPVVIVISFYFKKHRMLANGIILCASGVGTLSLPYFVRYVIDAYGWRYAFALNGAIILHTLIFASVFFPTETERKSMVKFSNFFCWGMRRTRENAVKDRVEKDEREKLESSEDTKQNGLCSTKYDMILKSGLMIDSGSGSLKSNSKSQNINNTSIPSLNKGYIPVYANGTPEVKRACELAANELEVCHVGEAHIKNGSLIVSTDDLNIGNPCPCAVCQRRVSDGSDHSSLNEEAHLTESVWFPRQSEKYKLGHLRKGSTSGQSYLGSSIHFASSELGSSLMLPVKIEEVTVSERESKSSLVQQILRICKNKAVWLLSINSLFFICGCGIHTVHFPAYAESKGASRPQVAQFYTAFGLVMMLGRLGGGMVFNRLKLPLCVLLFILQSLNGISLGLAPFYATTVPGIFVMEAAIGLLYGQSYMLLPPLITQIMGIYDLAIAFGIIHLFLGAGYIASPILAGFIYDATETYDIPFYLGGALVVIGAFSIIPMFFFKREADANEENDEEGVKQEN